MVAPVESVSDAPSLLGHVVLPICLNSDRVPPTVTALAPFATRPVSVPLYRHVPPRTLDVTSRTLVNVAVPIALAGPSPTMATPIVDPARPTFTAVTGPLHLPNLAAEIAPVAPVPVPDRPTETPLITQFVVPSNDLSIRLPVSVEAEYGSGVIAADAGPASAPAHASAAPNASAARLLAFTMTPSPLS